MHEICRAAIAVLLAALAATPAAAKAPPPPPPPLPPLILPADAPVVTVSIAGASLRLRVDPGASGHVALNASAARRLGLADPGRLVAGRPADRSRVRTDIGKVKLVETTIDEIIDYQGRLLPRTLAWGDTDHVSGADGLIAPLFLPHDEVRLVRRPASAADRATILPMRWVPGRGLLGNLDVGAHRVDIIIAPAAAETIATASAAAYLFETHGGRLAGPIHDAVISHGVRRPVRDLSLVQPVDVAGVRITTFAGRVFDWSGKTSLPGEAGNSDEIVVAARVDAQRNWPKLAIGNDRLAACAAIVWRRLPLELELICPPQG